MGPDLSLGSLLVPPHADGEMQQELRAEGALLHRGPPTFPSSCTTPRPGPPPLQLLKRVGAGRSPSVKALELLDRSHGRKQRGDRWRNPTPLPGPPE